MKNAIVLYPSPGRGHLNSMVELGKLILSRYPSLTVNILLLSSPNSDSAQYIASVSADAPSITFHHLPSIPPPPPSLNFEERAFQLPLLNNPGLLITLQSISETSSIKAFVIDFFNDAAYDVAKSLNIPIYYFFTSGAGGLAMFFYIPTIHKICDARNLNLNDIPEPINVPGLPPIRGSDFPRVMHDRSSKVYRGFLNTANHVAKCQGVIVNSFQSLEERSAKSISDGLCLPDGPTPPVYYIGPIIETSDGEEEHECLKWLSSQPRESVLFLAFGSRGALSAKQIREVAVALERSGHRFLWVVRDPSLQSESQKESGPNQGQSELGHLFPAGFLEGTKERGLVVNGWAPQVAVLSHASVGGFVTHCGWNSVLESVCAGVPMLAWPLYAEQRMNKVFAVEEMKVAVPVTDSQSEDGVVSAAELERQVRELMESERVREVRKNVRRMKIVAAEAQKEGGSSCVDLEKLTQVWRQ